MKKGEVGPLNFQTKVTPCTPPRQKFLVTPVHASYTRSLSVMGVFVLIWSVLITNLTSTDPSHLTSFHLN